MKANPRNLTEVSGASRQPAKARGHGEAEGWSQRVFEKTQTWPWRRRDRDIELRSEMSDHTLMVSDFIGNMIEIIGGFRQKDVTNR